LSEDEIRERLSRSIATYEKRLAQARADLAHMNAAITIFATSGDGNFVAPYIDTADDIHGLP
jgi:hypothetical protein